MRLIIDREVKRGFLGTTHIVRARIEADQRESAFINGTYLRDLLKGVTKKFNSEAGAARYEAATRDSFDSFNSVSGIVG